MAFNALHGESMMITKRNKELMDSLKKVTLEKEALEDILVSMENKVAIL